MNLQAKLLIPTVLAALALPAFSAPPPICQTITPAKISEIANDMAALQTAVASAVAAQKMRTANGVGSVDIGPQLTTIRANWNDKLKPWYFDSSTPADHPLKTFNLAVDKMYDPTRSHNPDLSGNLAPYLANITGIWLTSELSYPRYWASIGVFYYRDLSPQGRDLTPSGKTTFEWQVDVFNRVDSTMQKVRRLNKDATDCMGAFAW